ncbi:MAG: HAD family hydrolase [Holophagales bacterium]|nr:HAD family hydrolase [Holophagales bacterium]MYC10968.1 HAD family hydrolase [Holophagales bacterium]
MAISRTVPWAELDTIFFDAGNTFLSMDFDRVAAVAASLGVACSGRQLERAEAAARPVLSAALAERRTTEGGGAFRFYLRATLERLPASSRDDVELEAVVSGIAERLFSPGRNDRLWNRGMPGRREALERIRALGYRMVVVSNSDGSMARTLTRIGMDHLFDGLVDSTVVGFEKPDPRIFEVALDLVGARPERTAHVGDLYAADVAGAWAAGVHAVLLDPWADWPEMDCPKVADLDELASLLPGPPGRA